MEFAWSSGSPDPSSFTLWHSSQIPSEANNWAGQNIPGWRNARADALIRQADNRLSPKERAPLYAAHQQLFSQELPTLPIYTPPRIVAVRDGLKNFRVNGIGLAMTWNVQEWFLSKRAGASNVTLVECQPAPQEESERRTQEFPTGSIRSGRSHWRSVQISSILCVMYALSDHRIKRMHQ